MRSFEDLTDAINEGRGIRLDDGRLITTHDELALAVNQGEPKKESELDYLQLLTVKQLYALPEAEGIPSNLPKAELIVAIQAKSDAKD